MADTNRTPRPAPATLRRRCRCPDTRERPAPGPRPCSAGTQPEAGDLARGLGQGPKAAPGPPPGLDAPGAPRDLGNGRERNAPPALTTTGAPLPGHESAKIPRLRRALGLGWRKSPPARIYYTCPARPAPKGPRRPEGRPRGDPRQDQAPGAAVFRSLDGAARRPTLVEATGGAQDPRGERRAIQA